MRKYGGIPPEGKYLKQCWASRDDQRDNRASYRQREKQGLLELMREIIVAHEPTWLCHNRLQIAHEWSPESQVDDEWFPDRIVYISRCMHCNQTKYRYGRKEEKVQDCEA
jgi:hypothetical protein